MPGPAAYLDHAATTPVRPEVREAMLPYLGNATFGNPSSAHRLGREARAGLEQARREVAEAAGVEPEQVLFTSGGTEADNLAIVGTCLAARTGGRPMTAVVAATEHKAVLAAAHFVEHLGGSELVIPVDANGLIEWPALDAALAARPAVASVMWVNNETGIIQPVAEIARRCAEHGVPFHTDAVQAFGRVATDVAGSGAHFVTISGHKLGAAKGIGALLVRDRDLVEPLVRGGGQQGGLRPGTENIAGAVGLGRAALLAAREFDSEASRLAALRAELHRRLRTAVPDLVVVGEAAPRVPHILNVLVPGADGETLLMHLDLAGIAVSGGSACTTGAIEPSHVLLAMGVPRSLAASAVRFSLGRETAPADIARAAEVFPEAVARVRRLSLVLGRA